MSSVASHFADSYAEAREVLRLRRGVGGSLRSLRNPTLGPDGGRLFMDVARYGADDAPKMLVLMAATHGVEGYCGSGAMINWLRAGRLAALPADTGALLIHGVNPHGFAWIRRVNEDNVDVNRNFVDHGKPYPPNAGYVAIADALKPVAYDEASLAEGKRVIDAFTQEHGAFGFQQAVSGGQYSHPQGLFFGGHKPTWTNRAIRRVIREELGQARLIGCIDFHTGLGPFGYGEIINVSPPGGTAFEMAKRWYGEEMTSTEQGSSTSAVVTGAVLDAFPQEAPDAAFCGVALEYGTYPVDEVLEAVRRDNWLHVHGDLGSTQGRDFKAYLRERFYPAGAQWAEMVWTRADETIGMALKGLATS